MVYAAPTLRGSMNFLKLGGKDMMHNRNITGNKIETSVLNNPLSTNFVIPEAVVEEVNYREQSDLHNQQNKITIELLEKAIVHVRQYDSLETATKIVAKAFHKCPSMYNRKHIVDAQRSLKAAIKADKWAKSRRRKRHVDASTVRRNIDTFYEKVAETVESIRLDLDKRSLTLFSKIKKQYESTLPLVLPADKKAVKKSAHIIAMCESKPSDKYKTTRLEGNLYLIENAIVVGINRKAIKTKASYTTADYAEGLAKRSGKTIYTSALSRPSDNIDWYLVQDFGTNITFASFADKMDVHDNPETDDLSFEGYLKRQSEEKRVAEQYKTKRLRDVREAFNTDNIAIFDDIRTLKISLENMIFERSQIAIEFSNITMLDGHEKGLDINQVSHLYDNSMSYRKQLQHEGLDFYRAHRMSLKQRLEAKSCYYDHVDITRKIKETRDRINFLASELEQRKNVYARKLGMVSESKYVHFDGTT